MKCNTHISNKTAAKEREPFRAKKIKAKKENYALKTDLDGGRNRPNQCAELPETLRIAD